MPNNNNTQDYNPLQPFYSNLWRWKCGMPEIETTKQSETTNYNELKASEWSYHFENLMRNRLIMGALRYGKIGYKNKPKYDRVSSIISRINNYVNTGNKEYLVDIANICLLEFVECQHPNGHFKSVDDGEHVKYSI